MRWVVRDDPASVGDLGHVLGQFGHIGSQYLLQHLRDALGCAVIVGCQGPGQCIEGRLSTLGELHDPSHSARMLAARVAGWR